jgi:ketosteroid isomerase-like protein
MMMRLTPIALALTSLGALTAAGRASYHTFVRRNAQQVFDLLNRGDYDTLMQQRFAPDTEHTMVGEHALGGVRHSAEATRQWFARVYRLFPERHFTLRQVWVDGGPGDTHLAAHWTQHLVPQVGEPFTTAGVNLIHIRRGTVVHETILPNTQQLSAVLDTMARQGVAEAAAPPITD